MKSLTEHGHARHHHAGCTKEEPCAACARAELPEALRRMRRCEAEGRPEDLGELRRRVVRLRGCVMGRDTLRDPVLANPPAEMAHQCRAVGCAVCAFVRARQRYFGADREATSMWRNSQVFGGGDPDRPENRALAARQAAREEMVRAGRDLFGEGYSPRAGEDEPRYVGDIADCPTELQHLRLEHSGMRAGTDLLCMANLTRALPPDERNAAFAACARVRRDAAHAASKIATDPVGALEWLHAATIGLESEVFARTDDCGMRPREVLRAVGAAWSRLLTVLVGKGGAGLRPQFEELRPTLVDAAVTVRSLAHDLWDNFEMDELDSVAESFFAAGF